MTEMEIVAKCASKLVEQEQRLKKQDENINVVANKVKKLEEQFNRNQSQNVNIKKAEKDFSSEIRNAIWHFCETHFLDMSAKRNLKDFTAEKLKPMFYDEIVVPCFKKITGVDLEQDLSFGVRLIMQNYTDTEKTELRPETDNEPMSLDDVIKEILMTASTLRACD